MKKRTLILLATGAAASLVSAQITTYVFEDSNTLTGDFSLTTSASGDVAHAAGIGLGGSGGISNSSSGNNRFTAVSNAAPIPFSTSTNFSITQSIFFKTTSTLASVATETPVIIGLTGNATESDRGNAFGFANSFIHAGVRKTTSSNDLDFKIFTLSENNGFGSDQNSAKFTLETSTWYKFSVIYNFDSSGVNWTTLSTIDEASSDGSLVTNGNISTFSSTAQNNTFAAGDNLYGFFASTRGTDAGVAVYDDAVLAGGLTPIPEPSSYVLIAGILGLGLVMLRRRK